MLPDFRLRQREYLLEISRAMSARLDLSSLLELILESAVEILAGQAGLITLRRNDGAFAPSASIGLPVRALPLFEPLWRDLESQEKRKVIPDLPLRLALASKAAGVPLRQVVTLPLETGEDVTGYIFIFRARGAEFSSNDRQVLSAFANQAAVAVHNARLYQQVSAERERLDAIIENSGDGVMIINPYRIIQTWNRSLAHLTGIPAEEAIGRPCYDVLNLKSPQGVSICHTACPLVHPPEDGRLYAEGIHHRADGLAITLADNYSPQYNEEGEMTQVIANVRDMTRLREAEELKQTLLSVISHELKTPLASMRVLVDTLLEGNYRNQQQVTEYLELVSRENERLTGLIDNFLTFSRMERNKQAFSMSITSPAAIARDAAEAVKTKFSKGRCDFEMNVDEDLPQIRADRDAMVTVLVNLLDNAYKYSYDDKRIELKVYADNGSVCFSVLDNGAGMSRRSVRRIFRRFYQADRSLSRRAEGCGLGLSIAKFIVDAHKGSINVDSKPGEGSVFTVRLPAGG